MMHALDRLKTAVAGTRAIALAGSLPAAAAALGRGNETTAPIPAVSVAAVSPASGPLVGGTGVTVTGTNFSDVTGATIGGSELADRTRSPPASGTAARSPVQGRPTAGAATRRVSLATAQPRAARHRSPSPGASA